MGLISRIIDDSKFKLKTRPNRVTDVILGVLHALSSFADRIKDPLSKDLELIDEMDVPLSAVYNDNMTKIMQDANAVFEHQRSLLNGILVSWNTTEQVSSSNMDSAERSQLVVDPDFPVATVLAKTGGDITLALRSFDSGIPLLKEPPKLKATCTDSTVVPFYGKAYGLFVPGNESGEDGVRINRNDGGLIVDGIDTFWEAEAVTLQEQMDDTSFSPQQVNTNEVSVVVNLTLSFKNAVNINSFTIVPHNFAQSVYYDVISVDVISGGRSIPVLREPITCFSSTRITFDMIQANGINVSIRQNKGYFIKYTMAKYKLTNNEAWIDITGPALIDRVSKSKDDLNQTIRTEIENAGTWVPGIWVPDSPSRLPAVLQVGSGENGYLHVESVSSRRKRWSIGIQDILFGQETYENVSEVVTLPYDVPEETTSIYLIVDDETPTGTKITYSMSFDDGSSWYTINPINKQNQMLDNGYFVPQRIFINSDLSLTRKLNTLTGTAGYVNTSDRKVRVRGILEKDESTINTPRIRIFKPIFDTSVPS